MACRCFVTGFVLVALSLWQACTSAPRPRSDDNADDEPNTAAGPPPARAKGTVPAVEPEGFTELVQPFFEAHCTDCHGGEKPKADFRIGDLPNDFKNLVIKGQWAEVVDMLNSHEMPPDTEPQPDPAEVAKVVDWITGALMRAEISRRDATVVLRRLNREEYRNTIRDLTGVDYDVSGFPMDPTASGFDNVGEALTMSPLHLELYLDAARDILERALVQGPRPPVRKWHFEAEAPDSPPHYAINGLPVTVRGGTEGVRQGFRVLRLAGWDRVVFARDFTLPVEGEYIVRLRAGAVVPPRPQVVASAEPYLKQRLAEQVENDPKGEAWHRKEYESALSHFRTDPMYDYGPPRIKLTKELGGQPEEVAVFDVDAPRDSPQVLEFRTRFTTQRAAVEFEYAYVIPALLENFRFQGKDDFKRPEAWLDWYEIEGPIYDRWPPRSWGLILGDLGRGGEPEPAEIEAALTRFMTRAYRRPVEKAEVAEKMALYTAARPKARSFVEAIEIPLTAVLVSPHFLYLVEPAASGTAEKATNAEQGAGRPLTGYELASRLSYFLWSSMPDDTLFDLADKGTLFRAKVLTAQVNRMLDDPRSEAFVRNFSGQWLRLREVGDNPPVPQIYPRYDRHLEASIVAEGEAFFREILRNDLSVMRFLQSDFVVINERLGRFYGIPGVAGDRFRRVKVPKGVSRGGVVTQAAMLTITSNGTRTSPVKRGVWVLENLLGMDPGEPVANAGEIAPKVPGIDKATVRQRLQIHRELPQCARCHDKMDPLGFALENFNAAGDFRDKEATGWRGRTMDNDPPIDASAKLPDGTEFTGVRGLQEQLTKRRELFLRCLSSKLLTYALGRELTMADQSRVAAAAEHLQGGSDSLRSLIQYIAHSEAFQTK